MLHHVVSEKDPATFTLTFFLHKRKSELEDIPYSF